MDRVKPSKMQSSTRERVVKNLNVYNCLYIYYGRILIIHKYNFVLTYYDPWKKIKTRKGAK